MSKLKNTTYLNIFNGFYLNIIMLN